MTTYSLHYVGQGLYTIAQFETEARKSGVARALPARVVRSLRWGDRILLARWMPDSAAQRASMTFQQTLDGGRSTRGMTFTRYGDAQIFGSFRAIGLNMRVEGGGETEVEAKSLLASQLNVVGADMSPIGVRRRCGSYTIGATYYVTDTIEEILDKAAKIEKARGVRFKWFVTGVYESLGRPVTLCPARFSRGIVRVEVEGFPETPAKETDSHTVGFVLDYSRRTYIRKGDDDVEEE